MIQVKAPYSGWHEVTREQALEFATSRYTGMTCKNKMDKVNTLIKGVSFSEEELRNRAKERNGQSHARAGEA